MVDKEREVHSDGGKKFCRVSCFKKKLEEATVSWGQILRPEGLLLHLHSDGAFLLPGDFPNIPPLPVHYGSSGHN